MGSEAPLGIFGFMYLEEREKIVLRKLKEHNALPESPKTAGEIGLKSQDFRTMKRLIRNGLAEKQRGESTALPTKVSKKSHNSFFLKNRYIIN